MSRSLLLAIDVGNTNIVFALCEGDKAIAQWRTSTDTRRTADEYAVWLTQLMGLRGLQHTDVGAAIVASVVPNANFEIWTLCERYFRATPMAIGDDGIELGLKINLDRPRDVGADRLVNAVAAHARYPGWLIVIDFGTATTFDVLSAAGDYEGGVIAPGIHLSLEALEKGAARLPRIAVERPARIVGKSTVPAMQSGIFWGYVGLIEGLVARIKSETGQPMTTIATGGLAPLFVDATAAIDRVDADLTLFGLCKVYDLNLGQTR